MQLPTSAQTIFNFALNRILDNLDPLYQIAQIKVSSNVIKSDFLNGSFLPIFLDSKSTIQEINRHVVNNVQYLDASLVTKGYSVIKIISNIAESRLFPVLTTSFFNYVKSNIIKKEFELVEVNDLSATLYPYDYVLNYDTLTFNDITKITTSITIEDTLPSIPSLTNTLYMYEILSKYMNSVKSTSIWAASFGNVSYISYLQSGLVDPINNVSTSVINSDLSTFIGSNSNFYSTLTTFFFNSISGTSKLTQTTIDGVQNVISSSVASVVYPKLATYFNDNIGLFVQNVSIRYLKMFTDHHIHQLITTSVGLDTRLPKTEAQFIQFLEDDYFSNFSDILDDLDVVNDELSENAIDFLNNKTYLYQFFVESLNSNIEKYKVAFNLPTELLFNGNSNQTEVSSLLDTYIASISFLSSDIVNNELMESAISLELSSVIKSVLDDIFNSTTDFSTLFLNIDNVFGVSLDTATSLVERTSRFMTLLTTAFNYELINNPNSVIPTFLINAKNAMNYAGTIPVGTFNTTSWFSTFYGSSTDRSLTVTRFILASYYNYRLNASIDNFSINPIV